MLFEVVRTEGGVLNDGSLFLLILGTKMAKTHKELEILKSFNFLQRKTKIKFKFPLFDPLTSPQHFNLKTKTLWKNH